jgi:hypothetical protein
MPYDLVAKFKLDDKMSDKIRNIGKEADKLRRQTEGLTGSTDKFTRRIVSGASSAASSLTSITSHALKASAAIGGIGVAAAGIGAAAGALKLVKDSLKSASDYEQNNVAMEHFLGLTQGAEKAKEATKSYVDYLEKNANLTPFETGDVMNAGRRLINVTSGDITQAKKLLTVSENMAALNPGKSLMDAVEALADMKTGDMERMKEFGFKISAKDIEKAGGGAKGALALMMTDVDKMFEGGADKLSKTSLGMWSTVTGTFKTGIAHMGMQSLDRLKPELQKMSDYVSHGGADKLFDAGSRMMDKLTKSVITGAHQAKDYLNNHFITDPEFAKLTTLSGKVQFAFDDLKKTFDSYYEKDGKTQLQGTTSKIIGEMSDMIAASSSQISEIGATLGGSLASGMLEGLEKFAKENKKMAALMAFISTPGSLQMKTAAAIAVGTGGVGVVSDVIDSAKNVSKDVSSDVGVFKDQGFGAGIKSFLIDPFTKFFNTQTDAPRGADGHVLGGRELYDYNKARKVDGSHAGGLDRVPYSGYTARLHADEKILTKSEADSYRSNRGGMAHSGPLFTVAHLEVRNDSDIEAVADALATNIQQAHRAGAYAV